MAGIRVVLRHSKVMWRRRERIRRAWMSFDTAREVEASSGARTHLFVPFVKYWRGEKRRSQHIERVLEEFALSRGAQGIDRNPLTFGTFEG